MAKSILGEFIHGQIISPVIGTPSGRPEYYFNPAIFCVADRFGMIFRYTGASGKRVLLSCWLDESLIPIQSSVKSLSEELSVNSDWHADARVFSAANRLFMVFNNGIPKDGGQNTQWIVELDSKNLTPLGKPRPLVLGDKSRRKIEKNWQFFVTGPNFSEVLVVYSVNPHVILRATNLLAENSGPVVCSPEYRTSKALWWFTPEMRGGTPPLLVDDRYWSFFHYIKKGLNRKKTYLAGWYSFDAVPPYRLRSRSAGPLLWAGSSPSLPLLNRSVNSVVYPAGAVFNHKTREWYVSYGLNDESLRIIVLKHDLMLNARKGFGG